MRGGIASRYERHDLTHAHCHLQVQELCVKCSALIAPVRVDVRHDSSDALDFLFCSGKGRIREKYTKAVLTPAFSGRVKRWSKCRGKFRTPGGPGPQGTGPL